MKRYKQMQAQINSAYSEANSALASMENIEQESGRVAEVTKNAALYLNDIERQFDAYTKLTPLDQKFLFVAVALQCVRQYLIGLITQRTGHEESGKTAKKFQEKIFHSDGNSSHRASSTFYYASREEILHTFNVPYDATKNTKLFGVGGDGKGLSGTNHRFKTLGHDPICGLYFGTANIMTNTLTNTKGCSFHVQNMKVVGMGGYDITLLMQKEFIARSKENHVDFGLCLIKQLLHIASDMYSTQGIVLPYSLKLNEDVAKTLCSYGIDFGNMVKVGTQAALANLINQIIAMVHAALYDESIEYNRKMYAVRTGKILSYSNLIASSSNVIAVAIPTAIGAINKDPILVKKSLNYLDIGGLIVTINRIATDRQFQYEIKKEFIQNQWFELIMEG